MIAEVTSRVGADGWFPTFYCLTSRVAWDLCRILRLRRFHGGLMCPQASPPSFGPAGSCVPQRGGSCDECSSYHVETVYALGHKWRRECETARYVDPIDFVRRNARDRWGDTVAKADGAQYGWLQKPRRTVFESKWIDGALDGDRLAKELLYLVLCYVQGYDPPEPGKPLPYERFAKRLSTPSAPRNASGVARDIENLLLRLEEVRPRWTEEHVYAHSQHLARHRGIDDYWDAGPLDEPSAAMDVEYQSDEESLLLGWAQAIFRTAACKVRQGRAAEAALVEEITRKAGKWAALRAQRDPKSWRALLREVQSLAAAGATGVESAA